jgi:hypothetical protein
MGRPIMAMLLVTLWCAACGRAAPDTTVPLDGTSESGAAGTPVQTPFGSAVALLGDWELRSEPAQRMPGLHLTVTVDSVAGARYFGRLTNYFSGDVGGDPLQFQAFSDSLRTDGTVLFHMPPTDPDMLGIVLEGRLAADSILLREFVLGPDTLSSGTRRWVLVKRR